MSPSASPAIRRMTYRSVSTSPAAERERDRLRILAQCRLNNGLEAVTGILLIKGEHYLQVLEGAPESVAHIYRLIEADGRHAGIEVLEDDMVERRLFGGWGMAFLEDSDAAEIAVQVERFLETAPQQVRQAFAETM